MDGFRPLFLLGVARLVVVHKEFALTKNLDVVERRDLGLLGLHLLGVLLGWLLDHLLKIGDELFKALLLFLFLVLYHDIIETKRHLTLLVLVIHDDKADLGQLHAVVFG